MIRQSHAPTHSSFTTEERDVINDILPEAQECMRQILTALKSQEMSVKKIEFRIAGGYKDTGYVIINSGDKSIKFIQDLFDQSVTTSWRPILGKENRNKDKIFDLFKPSN